MNPIRKIIVIAAFSVASLSGHVAAGLVGHYEFDDAGDLAKATVGIGGALLGTPTAAAGQFGGGVNVQGSLTGINLGTQYDATFNTGDFTVSFWINSAAAGTDAPILSWASWDNYDGGHPVGRQGATIHTQGSGSLNIAAAIGDGTSRTDVGQASDTVSIGDQVWTLVALSVDSTNDVATLYSVLAGATSSETAALTGLSSAMGSRPASTFVIGEHGPAGGDGDPYNGTVSNAGISLIDDVRVFDTALSQSEVEALVSVPDPPELKVTVNRDTGALTLSNPAESDVTILGYQITSPDGALNPGNWLSIADNYDADASPPDGGTVDPDDTWTELTDPSARGDLSEFHFGVGDGATLAGSQSVDLGPGGGGGDGPWIKYIEEELVFHYTLSDDSVVLGIVEFTGTNEPYEFADLDFDGDIDIDDWEKYIDGFATPLGGLSIAEAYAVSDLDGNGQRNMGDFLAFRDTYDAANGQGALAAIMAVPEPSAGMLLMFAVVGTLCFRRRRCKIETGSVGRVMRGCLSSRSCDEGVDVAR